MTLTTFGTRIDLREIAPRDRHAAIFATYRSLGEGEVMELLNDHDPKALQLEFQADKPGGFEWECQQTGADLWRLRITKLKTAHRNDQCCGSCGGA